jgi:valyl-tRNA synthetase
MLERYPEPVKGNARPDIEKQLSVLQNFASELRKFRGENNVSPSVEIGIYVRPSVGQTALKDWVYEVENLTRVKIRPGAGSSEGGQDSVIPMPEVGLELRIPLTGVVDPEAERARLLKEKQNTQAEIDRLEKKLGNEGFVARAPQAVVEGERKKLAEMKAKLAKLGAG